MNNYSIAFYPVKPVVIKAFLLCLFSIVSLVGCTTTTTGIWEKPTYTDNINRFLTTVNGENIIFIGAKYHYIFENNKSLRNILSWKYRELLAAQLEDSFVVD
ncbi:MAG: hypothetical protein ACYSR0_05620, partial [Planctomycetota bacterium]